MTNGLKKCTACGQHKQLEDFPRLKASRDGKATWCRVCKSTYDKKYRAANKERIKETVKAWNESNPEKLKEYSRRYTEKNSERINEYSREWRKVNQPLCNFWTAEYRAKKAQASVEWGNKRKIALFYVKAKRLSAWLDIEHHVDHIVPIRSDLVCGLHNEFNLQLLTKTENLQKLNSWWPDMP